jgi:hypothetical protein
MTLLSRAISLEMEVDAKVWACGLAGKKRFDRNLALQLWRAGYHLRFADDETWPRLRGGRTFVTSGMDTGRIGYIKGTRDAQSQDMTRV